MSEICDFVAIWMFERNKIWDAISAGGDLSGGVGGDGAVREAGVDGSESGESV